MSKEHVDVLIKPEVQKLIDRGNVTYEEYEKLYLNSYERYALYPVMTTEALLTFCRKHILPNLTQKLYPTTYEEAVLTVLFPLLLSKMDKKREGDLDE